MDAYLWNNIEQQGDAEKWGYNTLEMQRRSQRDHKVFEEWGGGILGAVGVATEYVKTGDVLNAVIESIPYLVAGKTKIGTIGLATSYTTAGVANAEIQDLQHRKDDFGATGGLSNTDYNTIAATGMLYATLNRGATSLMTRTGGGTIVGASEDFVSKNVISHLYKVPWLGGIMATTASVGVKSGLVAGGGEGLEELIQSSVFDPILNDYYTIKQKLTNGSYLEYYRETLLDQGLIAAGVGGATGGSIHFGLNSYSNMRNGILPGTDRVALYEHKLGEADKAIDEELSILARSMVTDKDRDQTITHLDNTLERLTQGKKDLEEMQNLRDKVVETDEYKNLLEAFNNKTKAETELAKVELKKAELEGSTTLDEDFTEINLEIGSKQEVYDNYQSILENFDRVDKPTSLDIDGQPSSLKDLLYKFDMAGTSVASIERMNTIFNNKKEIEDKLGKDLTKELDIAINNYLGKNASKIRDEDIVTLEAVTALLLTAANKKQDSKEVDHSNDITLKNDKGEKTGIVVNEDNSILVNGVTHYVVETENGIVTVRARDTNKDISEKGNAVNSTEEIGNIETAKTEYQNRTDRKAKETILNITKNLKDTNKNLEEVMVETALGMKDVLSKDEIDSISNQLGSRKRTTMNQKIAFSIGMINGLDRTQNNNQVQKLDDVIRLTSDYKTKIENSKRTVHQGQTTNTNVVKETAEDLAGLMKNVDWTQFYKTRLKRRSATKVREELDKWDNGALALMKQTNSSSESPVKLLNRLIDIVIKDRDKTDNLLTTSRDDYVFNIERIVSEKYHKTLGINPVTASYEMGRNAWSPIATVEEDVVDIPKPDELEEAAKVIVSSGTKTNAVVEEFNKKTKDMNLDSSKGLQDYVLNLTGQAIQSLISKGMLTEDYNANKMVDYVVAAIKSGRVNRNNSEGIKQLINDKVYELSGEDKTMSAKITNTTRLADLKTAVQNKVATDKTDTKSLVKLALISTIESMYGTRDFTIQDIVDEMLKMDMTEKSKTEEERTVYMQNAVEVIDELFNDEGSSAQAGIIINAVFSASDTIGKDSATEVNKAFNSEVINKSSVKLLSKQMFGDSLKVKLYKGLNDKQKKNKSKSGTTIKPKNEKKGKQASVIRTFSNIINYFNTGNTEHIYEEGSTVSDSLKQANSETFMPENISEMYNKALEKLPNLDALVSSREQGSQSAVFNSNDSTQEYEGKVKILLTLGINEVLDNMSSNMDIESKNTSPENYTSTIAAKKYEVVNQIGKKYMDLFGLNVYNSKDKAEIIAWRNKIGEEAIVLLKQLGMIGIQKDVEFTVDPNSLVKDDGKSVYRNKSSVSITNIKAFKETGKKSTSKSTKIDKQTGIVLTGNLVDNTLIHKVGNTEPVNFFNLDGYEKTEKDTIVSMLFQRFSGIKDPLRPLNPGNKHTPSANKVETPRVQKDGAKIAKEHQEFIDKMQENPLKLSNTAKKILLPLVKAYAESVGDAKGGYVTVMKFLRQNGKGKNIARMLGITSAEVGLVDDNLASNLGKELGKGNHLVNILRFITENSEDGNYEEFMKRDLYFSHDVGRNMRGHLNEQTLNYQADKKYSRNLLTGGEYTTSNMTEYLILIESISDKTGLSSDQILNDSGNDVLEILLTDDNIDSAIADIVDNIVESEEGVSEANRELLQSLDLKGSGLMGSAVAIKAIKDIRTAYKSDNKFSVTTEYMAEVDATSSGFTNISLNLLGYKHNKATTKHYLEQGDQNLLEGGVIDGYKVLTKLLEGLRSKLVNNTEAEGTKKELSTAEKMLAMAGKNLDKESTVGDNLKIGAKIMFDVLGMSPRDAAKMPSMVRGYHASIQAISRNIQIDMRSGLLEAYASGNTKAIEVLNEVLGRGTEIDINNLDLNDYKAISEAIAPLADRIAKEAQNSLKDQTDISDKFIGGSYDLLADIIHKGLIPNYKTIKMNSIFEVMKGVTPNRANAEVLMKQKHVLLENGGLDTNGNILVDLKDMPNSPTSKVIPFHMIDSYLLAQSYSEAYTEVYGSTDQDTTNKIRYGVMTVHDAVYGNTEMLAAFNKHYNGNTIKVAKEYDVVEQMLNEVKYVVDTYEGELKTTPRGKTHLKKMKDHIVKMEKVIATAKAEKEEILKSVDSVQVMGATKPNVKKDILNGIIKNDKELGKLKDSMNSVLTDLKSNEDGILSKEQIKKVNKINEYLKEC
ncbi:MAG: hypothetical protein U9Q66_03055 [Patescibacteria group bacterium]|nr:hypothetical protein [Patescibacteria group bacterium]